MSRMLRITPRRHALLLAAGVHFGMGGSIGWLAWQPTSKD